MTNGKSRKKPHGTRLRQNSAFILMLTRYFIRRWLQKGLYGERRLKIVPAAREIYARNMADKEGPVTVDDLPIAFQVKYLGQSDARGLWGIKHTRRPVDLMVAAAKALPPGQILPIVRLTVSPGGVHVETLNHAAKQMDEFEHMSVFFNIESISYGVQDLVYTRVFSMIIVKDNADVKGLNPFECHAFVCESRNAARRLTYSLAAAFQDYSRRVKAMQTSTEQEPEPSAPKKRFAIDLRTPEEIEADLETEA